MNIIVGIDARGQRHDALALGADLARLEDGRLLVVHVYPWSRSSARLGSAYAVTVTEDAQELLDEATRELKDIPCETRAVGDVSTSRALHRIAAEEDADVIVIGSSHHGTIGRAVVGGTGDRVLHASPAAVAIAPRGYEQTGGAPRRIGVAYDTSPQARGAVAWAGRLAAGVSATVKVLTVYEPMIAVGGMSGVAVPYEAVDGDLRKEAQGELDEIVASLPSAVRPYGELLDGPVYTALADAAQDLDLLVMGSRGYGPHGAVLLGSVAHGLSHMCPCPLIVLPRSAQAEEDEPAAEAAVASPGA